MRYGTQANTKRYAMKYTRTPRQYNKGANNMKIATRIRPENDAQQLYKLRWSGAFGPIVLNTFITEAEAAKYTAAGIDCEKQ